MHNEFLNSHAYKSFVGRIAAVRKAHPESPNVGTRALYDRFLCSVCNVKLEQVDGVWVHE